MAAWSLLSPSFSAADVFVHPALQGSDMAPALWAWTFARLPAGEPLQTMWVAEDDAVLRGILAAQGFKPQPGAGLIELRCALEAPQLVVPAPLGFSLRCLGGEAELATRASASHAAFESRLRLDTYVERYRRFMRAPGYAAADDLVAVEATSGAVAAFAVAWPDSATGLGLFEPVGTHPAYRRRGLARALLAFGLSQFQAAGMRFARVNVEADNQPALAMYTSLGFQPARRLLVYQTAV